MTTASTHLSDLSLASRRQACNKERITFRDWALEVIRLHRRQLFLRASEHTSYDSNLALDGVHIKVSEMLNSIQSCYIDTGIEMAAYIAAKLGACSTWSWQKGDRAQYDACQGRI